MKENSSEGKKIIGEIKETSKKEIDFLTQTSGLIFALLFPIVLKRNDYFGEDISVYFFEVSYLLISMVFLTSIILNMIKYGKQKKTENKHKEEKKVEIINIINDILKIILVIAIVLLLIIAFLIPI